MKRFLNIAGALYVCFALLAAHTALAPTEKAVANSLNQSSEVETPARTLCDRERLDFSDTRTVDSERKHYRIEAWTASWCRPCQTWKARELPALLKAGFKVEVLDVANEKPPKGVTVVPTICLYYKGELIELKVNWKAKDIEKFIEGRMSLKK